MKILLCGGNGYIGSLFYEFFKKKYDIFSIDNLLVNKKRSGNFKIKDYRNLKKKFLNNFQVCLWLCGHSSVSQSMANPSEALQNNTLGLIEFSKIFSGTLIYASSGSVYNNSSKNFSNEKTFLNTPMNIYDFTKLTIDNYFSIYPKNFISLRFGTVVGASKSFRSELLLNKMCVDAISKGVIDLSNKYSYRPILFINDLINALDVLISKHNNLKNNIYNLCSLNHNMKTYANLVSKYFNVKINHLPDTKTYSFKMDNSKFINHTNFKFTKNINLILKNIDFYIKNKKLPI